MIEDVELFSASDPVHVPNRQVWYWTEFRGMTSERLTEARAEAIRAHHDAALIDRSDKGTYLRLTLG